MNAPAFSYCSLVMTCLRNGSSSSIDDEDKARPQYCRPLKNGNYAGTAVVDGVEYPIYHYQVLFQNVKEILDAQDPSEKVSQVWKNGISYERNWFEAVDYFNTSVFRYLDAWNEDDLSIMASAGINTTLADRLLRLGGTTGDDVSWQPAIWNSDTNTFRFYDWNQIPRPNGNAVASNYVFNYYLIVKDEEALHTLQNSTKSGDTYSAVELNNTIAYTYNNASSSAKVSYVYSPVSKNLMSFQEDTRTAHYRIALNELQETMNGGNPMTMTDDYTNISVDFETVQVTTVPAANASQVIWNYSQNIGTFTIPDATKVIIEYDATVLGSAGDEVTFTNTATLGGKYSDGTSDTRILNASGGGVGVNYRIRLSK